MRARVSHWSDVPEDEPIDLLRRRIIRGDQAMVARVEVKKGCLVERHSHPMEQISIVASGRTRWILDEDQHEVVAAAGEVVVLPGGCKHAMEALEDSVLIDVVSPPGAMGVDTQRRS